MLDILMGILQFLMENPHFIVAISIGAFVTLVFVERERKRHYYTMVLRSRLRESTDARVEPPLCARDFHTVWRARRTPEKNWPTSNRSYMICDWKGPRHEINRIYNRVSGGIYVMRSDESGGEELEYARTKKCIDKSLQRFR